MTVRSKGERVDLVRCLALVIGLIITAIGVSGMAAPAVLLHAARFAETPAGLYVVAALRIAFGLVLLQVAVTSRTPKTLRMVGMLIVVAGIVTPLIGVERAHAIVDWWSAQGTAFMRSWAALAVVFGLFIIYAVTPRRQAA